MASKKEQFENVQEVLAKYEDIPAELVAELEEILKPKAGGKSFDIDEVTKKDEEGVITDILCSLSGLWLPADLDTFYEDKSGKGIPTEDEEVTLKRVSKQGYQISTKFKKSVAASKQAVFNDVLDGELTPEDGKAKVEALDASEPDYSEMVDADVA